MLVTFKNVPNHFECHIKLLADLVCICALVYLDNILIFSYTEEDHQKYVCIVSDGLAKYHVKHKKCKLSSKKVNFLGHVVSAAVVGII